MVLRWEQEAQRSRRLEAELEAVSLKQQQLLLAGGRLGGLSRAKSSTGLESQKSLPTGAGGRSELYTHLATGAAGGIPPLHLAPSR